MSILAKVNPTTTVGTVLYTAPAGRKPLVNINVANVSQADASFTLALVQKADKSVVSVTAVDGGEYSVKPTIAIAGNQSTAAVLSVDTVAVKSAALSNGGAGYTVGNQLSLVGGTQTVIAQVTVASVDANGAILSVSLSQQGNYTVIPTGPNVSVTGGTGTGGTFVLTWKILTVTVVSGGNGYDSDAIVFTTVSTGTNIAGVFTAQFSIVLELTKDTYHPITVLNASGVLERTGVTLSAGDSIVGVSTVPGALNFIVLGYEDVA